MVTYKVKYVCPWCGHVDREADYTYSYGDIYYTEHVYCVACKEQMGYMNVYDDEECDNPKNGKFCYTDPKLGY